MPVRVRDAARLVRDAVVETLLTPSMWRPALVLLAPTLALQLLFPEFLRSRLSPSIWTVVAGAVAMAWLTQVASAAAFALVHRRRGGATAPLRQMIRVALVMGTATFAGLLAGAVPGWWLQARWAFAPFSAGEDVRARLRVSASETAGQMTGLLSLGIVALGLSLLGQSMAAAAAEAAGTIVPAGAIDGRTTFALRYLPHALTSVLAWWLAAVSVTVHAVGVSRCHDRVVARQAASAARRRYSWPTPVRAVVWVSIATVVGIGLVAATMKVQQHL
jgi:hypothetical protein